MTKQDILNTTGLSEEEFYQRYPDQETFCSDYPEMCPDMVEDNYDEENVSEEDINNYQNLGYDEDEISMAAYGGSLYKAQDGLEKNKVIYLNPNKPIQLKEVVIKPSVETYVQRKPIIDRGNFSKDYEKPITPKDLSLFPWLDPQRVFRKTKGPFAPPAPLALRPPASGVPITDFLDYTKEYLKEMDKRAKRKDANEPLFYKDKKSTVNLWKSILANNPRFPEGSTQQFKDSIFDNHFRAYKKIFNENNAPYINIGENIIPRTHYNEPTNTIELSEPDRPSLLAELSHANQQKDGRSVWGEYAIDWKNHPFYTNEGQLKLYDIPGTIEHDAHSLREPLLRKKFREYLKDNARYINYIDNSESPYNFGKENVKLKASDFGIGIKKEMGGSLYEAQDGVQTTAPYTDYNQYQNAMQNYYAEASKANAYNNFQNDLYNLSGKTKGFSETPRQMGDMFNTLSPEQQDAFAQKHGAEFITNTSSANRRNYINSMVMNVPGKGTGYYSFPTNDVVYGRKDLERPKYDFPKMTAPQYPMPATSPTNFQGKPINYQPGTATINLGNTNQQSKLNSLQSIRPNFQPTQIINNIGASYKDPASLNASNGNLPIPKYSLNRTMEKVGATNKPFVTSTPSYTSIVDLLKSRNQDSSFANRKKLAEEAGIKNYTGSASQNMDFINRINNNKASGAGMTSSSQLQNQTQQSNKPFYSPNNTSASYTNNNEQSYPAKKYTSIVDLFKDRGEDSSFSNRKKVAEKKGIKNYRGSAKQNVEFINRMDDFNPYSTEMELGGVNIHPAMRTNFKQGGLIKYEKGKEVKMKYGDFMNFVENPEMIQVDGMRSHYEPETNTIFYDTPRSIPDELGHAVQRANRNIGYSVPPNNNTMMRQLPEMQYVYPIDRENLNSFWVNENAGALNTIREINVPNNSNNSLSRTYVNKFFPGDEFGGNSYLKKLNDSNIYFVPGSGEYEAHQLIEPRIREDFFNYNKPQYKQGGYYGMDGRLHRAKGSGTYVTNGGYYFNLGGKNTTPPVASPDTVPGAMGDPIAVPQSSLAYNNPYQDYSFDMGTNEADGSSMGYSIDTGTDQTNSSSMGQQSMIDPYDPSKYSSAIDPSTGFTTWSKNNQAIKNIKKQDPALWDHLKDEGKGARWRTGQTDFQKFGRTAGYIGNVLENGINVASGIGNIINNRNEQRNLNNSAINKGSTASLYTNPQAAGKGTGPGQTGSSYGMMDPSSIGARSFTGMYGKYGMEVPKFQPGGGFSNLFSSAQSVLPISSPIDLIPNMSFSKLAAPVVDNTGKYQDNRAVNNNQPVDNTVTTLDPTVTTLDPDYALQAVAGIESGSKPGENKAGMRTKLIGEGGKRASASGTFQITTPTLKGIYNNDKNISSKYKNFNEFKSAFDTDPNVEYQAAKSLMSDHIKNYGVYALGAWYYPDFARKAAAGDKSVFDIVPRRDFGNRVKWGDDFKLKLNAYNKLAGTNLNAKSTTNFTNKNYAPSSNYAPSNANFSLKGLVDFAKTNKWVVTSTTGGRHNPGSRHKKSRAIDVSVKNKTSQQILDFIKLAQSQGYRVLDERVRPKGQKEWHGAHLHLDFEKGGQFGGQVMEMDENEIKQFLKAGGQLEFLD